MIVAGLIAAPGCHSGGGQSGQPDSGEKASSAKDPHSAASPTQAPQPPHGAAAQADQLPPAKQIASQVPLRIADRQVYEEVLAKHKGQPILVDFWATWCVPCTEQFPHTVELHAKYAAKGLAVVSVSLDDPADEAKVKAFLEKQRATFDNLLSKWGGDGPSFENFDIRAGTIPHYKLYDRDGQLRETFSPIFAEPLLF
jgi:thiol-disulfide isomerase/thioredoxin